MTKTILYNDIEFSIDKTAGGWNIGRKLPDGTVAVVGANLFADRPDGEAQAHALIQAIFPVGVKTVGPDVNHPNLVGNLKIIGPDVGHPNFICWNKDSASFAK